MRWIMSVECGPAIAVPADIPFEEFSSEMQIDRSSSSDRKRSLNIDPSSHEPGNKRKCSRSQEFPYVYPSTSSSSSSLFIENQCSKNSETPDQGPNDGTNISMCVAAPHFQKTGEEEMQRKEKYVLQIQRAMIADEDGDRPIHIAVVQEDVPLVKKLCKLMKSIGASLDIINHIRQTPLHLAVIVGNPQIIKILLQYGASISVQDRRGSNAIQLAVKYFRQECIQVLLEDPNSRCALDRLDYEGVSALHHAVLNGNTTAVNLLYHCGANVNAVDGKSGRSALIQAIMNENTEMVHLLLKCEASVTKMDYSGLSALDAAHVMNNKEIIQLIENETVNKQDNEKDTDTSNIYKIRSACSSSTTLQSVQKRRNKKESTSAMKLVICATRRNHSKIT